jgi:dihydrofolate reductase
MKVILYVGLSLNGMIAGVDGNTDWISKEDFANFDETCRKVKTVIMGRKSWDEMNPGWLPFHEGEGNYIVFTRNSELKSQNPKTRYFLGSPQEVIAQLESEGVGEVLVGGGGEIYGAFLTSGVVDELYVNFAPVIFGQGTRFFPESNLNLQLKLIETTKLKENTVQLHYGVER